MRTYQDAWLLGRLRRALGEIRAHVVSELLGAPLVGIEWRNSPEGTRMRDCDTK